jgi:CcmD family protein
MTMENQGYLLAVFTIVWVGLFAYIFSMVGKQKRLEREMESLRARLGEKGHGDKNS